MFNFIETIISSKSLMKIVMKYLEFFQEGSYFSYFLLLLKYIPLLIICHDWLVTNANGFFRIFGKLTLTFYLKKNSDLLVSNFIVYFLFIINFLVFGICYLSFYKLVDYDSKVKKYKKILLKSLFIANIVNFSLAQYFYESIFFLLFRDLSDSSANSIIKSISIVMSFIALALVLSLNITFSIINFRPYFIRQTYYASEINSFELINVIYPMLKFFIVAEYYIAPKTILIIKLIIRCLFILRFLRSLFKFNLKIYYIELFLNSFCLSSCLIEFIFIRDLFIIEDFSSFYSNPQLYSIIYQENFLLTKLILQLLMSLTICSIVKIFETNFLINFFQNIKKNKFYCFYNKYYELLKNMKNEKEEYSEVLSKILKSIDLHLNKCNISECLCHYYKSLFKKETNFSMKVFKKFLLSVLEKNLKTCLKRGKYSSSEFYCKYLLIDTIYCLYFKKHFAKCFFNIEKIQMQNFFKKNFFFRIQVFFLKYEVIVDFINFNKNSNNNVFKKMRVNYEKYNKYKNLENAFLKIFSDYKNLITLFYAKNISFSEYYFFIEKFFIGIKEANKMIKYIISNHDQHNSMYLRKIDYISNFLNGENIFISSHKINQYLYKNEDDKTEKLIVKHTAKKEFLIDFISPKLAEQLSLKTISILKKDFHDFMSSQFIEFHYSHIVNHIKNNMLLIKNKEIYFIDSHGYAMNYFVDGSILITLSGEILVFIEVNPICEEYKEKNISFISCDEEGELIALNKEFSKNFYIDVNVKNIVQPNLFKSILTINKAKLTFNNKNNTTFIKYPYEKLIKNIRSIDYSKLWDFKPSVYFDYLEHLKKDKQQNFEKIHLNIVVQKRNLQGKFFFFDLKFFISNNNDNTSMFKTVKDLPLPLNKQTQNNSAVNSIKETNILNIIENINPSKNEKHDEIENKKNPSSNFWEKIKSNRKNIIRVSNTINKIKSLGLLFRKFGTQTIKKAENAARESRDLEKFKNKLQDLEYSKHEDLRYKDSILRMIIFILFILGFFVYLGDYTKSTFSQIEIISKMKLLVNNLQQINYNIINTIFSLNLVSGNIQPTEVILKNLNYTSVLDNSISYHLKVMEERRDIYQENFRSFHNLYLNLDEYPMNIFSSLFVTETKLNILNNYWSFNKINYKLFDILEYNYRGISKIVDGTQLIDKKYLSYQNPQKFYFEVNENQNTNNTSNYFTEKSLLASDQNKFNNDLNPSLKDKNIFYFLENSLIGFRNSYDDIKSYFDNSYLELIDYYKRRLIIIFLVISSIVILFFIFEGIIFHRNYDKVFIKYFILFDIIKNFLDEIFLKIELLEELFMDFTDLNRNKYSKLTDDRQFMEKKLTSCETLKDSYNDIKTKIVEISQRKTSSRQPFIRAHIKTNRLLDYYENKIERNAKKRLFSKKSGNYNNEKIIPSDTKAFESFNYINQNTMIINTRTNMEEFKNTVFHNEHVDYFGDNEPKDYNHELENINDQKLKEEQTETGLIFKNSQRTSKIKTSTITYNNLLFVNSDLKKNHGKENEAKKTDKNVQIKDSFTPNAFDKIAKISSFKKNSSTKKPQTIKIKKKTMRDNEKDKDVSTLSSFNKTDASFLQNTNLSSNLKFEDEIENQISEEAVSNVKKSKIFYCLLYVFWMMILLIIILVVINIQNTLQRFDKIQIFDEYSIMFYKRICLFSEVLMIFQISVFKKESKYLLEESKTFIDKIYADYQSNEKKFIILLGSSNSAIVNLKDLNQKLNVQDSFCKFLAEKKFINYNYSNKTEVQDKYFNLCHQISQNFFSVGYDKAALNLYNYMTRENRDLVNYFNLIKQNIQVFSQEKLKFYLNDFYYIFSFVNHDRLISELHLILDNQIQTSIQELFIALDSFNNFIFYFLYAFIIMLGLFSIYKTKYLIHDSDKLITNVTTIVENSIKFYKLNEFRND